MSSTNHNTSGALVPAAGRRLALYAFAYSGSTALHKGLGFAVFMWLAYELPASAYASFGLLYALYSGVAALSMAGIVDAVIGLLLVRTTPDERQRLFLAAERVFFAMASICLGALCIGVLFFPSANGLPWLPTAAATSAGLLAALFTIRSHLWRLEENHRASLLLNLLPPIAALVGGSIAFAATHTVTGFFCGFALAMLAGFGIHRIRTERAVARLDVYAIASRLGPFMLVAILAWVSGYGNTWLVEALFTADDVARFAFIYTLASVMQLVATSLNQVWSPRIFNQLQRQSVAEVDKNSTLFFVLQGLVLGVFGALLLVVAPWLVERGGARFATYADLEDELFLLLAAYALAIPWYHVQNYFLAFGKGRDLMNVSLVSTAFGMSLWVVAMYAMGPIGVYAGFLLLTAARTVAAQFLAWRRWRVRTIWQGPVLALLLLVAALTLKRVAGG